MKELEDIFKIELQRLKAKASAGPLNPEDTNKLLKLTAALKNYKSSPIDEEDIRLDDLSVEEQIRLARMEIKDGD